MLKASDVTVVTAFYPMKSKMSSEKYGDLIRGFWPHLPNCRLVFYTDPGLVESIRGTVEDERPAGHTVVIPLPFEPVLGRDIWLKAEDLDPERGGGHSADLYAIWYEKKEFVRRTIETNPFQSEFFVWCDAGIGRYPHWLPLIQGFPSSERIPRGKMLCLEVDPLQPEDFELADPDFSERVATIGGGILAADAAGWKRWSEAYDAMLQRYLTLGRFIGKDQNIMASMIVADPSLAVCVTPSARLGPIEKWFYLLFFLAGLSLA